MVRVGGRVLWTPPALARATPPLAATPPYICHIFLPYICQTFAIYLQYISPCYGVCLWYSVSQCYGILSYGVSLFNVLEEEVLMVYIFSHANFYGTKVNIGSNL